MLAMMAIFSFSFVVVIETPELVLLEYRSYAYEHIIFVYLNPLLGADEVVGSSGSLSAMHDGVSNTL